MKKHWWKILGCILMVYAFVAGTLIPLSPSSYSISKQAAKTAEALIVDVRGYNTHYTSGGDKVRAWLRKDSTFSICASKIEVISDTELNVRFDIPPRVSNEDGAVSFSLIVDSGTDGYSVLPNAVAITQLPSRALQAPSCEIESLNQRKMKLTFPFRNILEETIRNLYYHVPLWFAMIILFFVSVISSVRFLNSGDVIHNLRTTEYVRVGVLYGILGLITGAIWARHTWGEYWNWDLRQNTAAIAVLIYLAYFVLRDSFDDEEQKARITAVYNIFAFAALIPLMFVIPRLADSLHPGAGGNPAFGSNDLDNTMRLVFYPAIIGFTLVGTWMATLLVRASRIRNKRLEDL